MRVENTKVFVGYWRSETFQKGISRDEEDDGELLNSRILQSEMRNLYLREDI